MARVSSALWVASVENSFRTRLNGRECRITCLQSFHSELHLHISWSARFPISFDFLAAKAKFPHLDQHLWKCLEFSFQRPASFRAQTFSSHFVRYRKIYFSEQTKPFHLFSGWKNKKVPFYTIRLDSGLITVSTQKGQTRTEEGATRMANSNFFSFGGIKSVFFLFSRQRHNASKMMDVFSFRCAALPSLAICCSCWTRGRRRDCPKSWRWDRVDVESWDPAL